MNKKIVIIPIIIIIGGLVILFSFNNDGKINKTTFHVTLATPEIYNNGIFSDTFWLESGEYFFRFVPNGDSPKSLSISLKGEKFDYFENFKLNATKHQTEISQYYTWDYDGQKIFALTEPQQITIEIDPNGDIYGSVSVDILENQEGVTPLTAEL